ncbi:MAG TPA: glycosyltransferase [Myxococcota bacterium]|nr:glycosyltransferase [Myxococcota bacterium]
MECVTVVMPAYDAERTVASAVRSVLADNRAPMTVLVLDDGSTDDTAARVEALGDRRVRLLRCPHRGLVATLNDARNLVETPYVARMDADDVCEPGRIDAQRDHLERHRDVDVVGGQFTTSLDGGPEVRIVQPQTPLEIRWSLMFRCPVLHPSVMARREAMRAAGPFDPSFEYAEDYELLCRNADRLRFANLPRVLVHKREHAGQISARHRERQQQAALRALGALLGRRLGRPVPPSVAEAFLAPRSVGSAAALAQAMDAVVELECRARAAWCATASQRRMLHRLASRRLLAMAQAGAARFPAEARGLRARWLAQDRAAAPRTVVQGWARTVARELRAIDDP